MNDKVIGLAAEAVIASGCLGRSKRSLKLFSYLLENTLAGTHMKVSEYGIGVDVIGRPESFDVTNDGIVRAEMHRLRDKLENFSAKNSDFEIEIPRASYQVVARRKLVEPKNAVIMLSRRKAGLLLIAAVTFPFVQIGFVSYHYIFDQKYEQECSRILPNVKLLTRSRSSIGQEYAERVIRRTISQNTHLNVVNRHAKCQGGYAPNFVFDYLVVEQGNAFNVTLTTQAENSSEILSFEQVSGSTIVSEIEPSIYDALVESVNEVAKPYGIIARTSLLEDWGSEVERINYSCIVLMYDSFAAETEQDYNDAHSCLENSVSTGLASLDNQGSLAASYLEQARQYRAPTVSAPFEEAGKILTAYKSDWVNSAELITAKMAYEVERDDYSRDRLRDVLSIAEAAYDTNPHVILLVSVYSGYKLGDWDRAKQLSERVKLLHSERDQSVYIVDAGFAFLYGEPDEAMELCIQAYSPNSVLANMIINACAKKFNNSYWADITNKALTDFGLISADQRINFIKDRDFDRSISDEFIKALAQ